MTDRPDTFEPGEIYLLLPWYAAGTLSDADRVRVESAIAADPALRTSLARIEEERDETVLLNQSMPMPRAGAFDALMTRIETEAPRRQRAVRGSKFVARLLDGIASLGPRTIAIGAVAAALLIVAEGGALVNLVASPPSAPGEYTTASVESVPASDQAVMLVAFVSTASIEAISDLLRAHSAVIIDGPKAGGLFRIAVAAADRDAVLVDLKAHPDLIRFAGPSK